MSTADGSAYVLGGSTRKWLAPAVRLARAAGFFAVYGFARSRLVEHEVAIILYHRIARPGSQPWSLMPTSPEDFEREMRYLRKRYQIVPLDELVSALAEWHALPPRLAAITFDDGYREIYTDAFPVLKRYAIPATVFLPTSYIGTGTMFWWDRVGYIMSNTRRVTLDLAGAGRYQLGRARERLQAADAVAARLNRMPGEDREAAIENLVSLSGVEVPPRLGRELVLSWDEVREMSRNGIRFGAHTVSHPVLTRVPLETARQEILDSKRRIEEETGQEVTTFAYPNGEPGDYNKDIEEILRGSGFRCAVTSGPAFVSAQTDRYELPRIPASSGFELFQLLMSGLYQDFGRKR